MTDEQLTIPAVDKLVPRSRWTPPSLSDFAHGLVQSYDQSLSNTGVVLLRASPVGIHLLAAQMIRPRGTDAKSIEGSYARADGIEDGIRRSRTGLAASADAVVYERTPVKGQRIESILLAGREIHRATQGRAVMVDNRHAKAVIVGRAGTRAHPVTKADVKEAVERYVTPNDTMPWNEHIRDAVMLGLTWLHDEHQRKTREDTGAGGHPPAASQHATEEKP